MGLSLEVMEERQREKHQLDLVRSLLEQKYSPREIIRLSKVKEIDLDEEVAKGILVNIGVGKSALRDVVKYLQIPLKILYTPFTAGREFAHNEVWENDSAGAALLTYFGWAFGNFLVGAGLVHSDNLRSKYILFSLSCATVNGLYELYKHSRNERIAENISELEQTVTNEEE